MYTLPYELAERIIQLSLFIHPIPSNIARVSSTWAEIALPLLHERIHLTSLEHLRLFAAHSHSHSRPKSNADVEDVRPLRCSARGREVEIRLPGGTPSQGMWAMIRRALARCQCCVKMRPEMHDPSSCAGRLEASPRDERYHDDDARTVVVASNFKKRCCRGVRELRLCLNSHMNDPDLPLIYPALNQIKCVRPLFHCISTLGCTTLTRDS